MLVSAKESYEIVKDAITGFFADDAMSHSAAMAFFAVTALSPVLLIVVAIAGLAFGHDAAQVALSAQLSGLMGPQSAELMETALRSAQDTSSGVMVAAVGLVTLLVTASGVFGEMQATLNKIWKVEPLPVSLSTLVRARAASLGLVAALGFLLLVSLAATAAISVLGDFITARLPLGAIILQAINAVVSLTLITLLFAAIYKVLPDRTLQWRDVMFGAFITALLFTIGKTLIGLYLGSSNVASSYGAAGGLLIILLWLFYSSIIFLLGAELTRAYSIRHGSRHDLRAELASPDVGGAAPAAVEVTALANDRHIVTTRRFAGVPDSMIIAGLTAVALVSAGLTMFRTKR